MERFSSLSHVPAETRRLLRDRLRSFLPSYRNPRMRIERALLDDELALRLLLGLQIDWGSDLDRARTTYEDKALPDDAEPAFQDLIKAGWIRVVWGRISAPIHMRSVAPAKPRPRFNALMAERHSQALRFSDEVRGHADLASIIDSVERTGQVSGAIACQTPEWVAARLWDRSTADSDDRISALRLWVDRWQAVGAPSIIPSRTWSDQSAEAFREGALEVIGSVARLDGWDEAHRRIVSEIALSINQPPSSVEHRVPPPPATCVGRALWLDNNQIEGPLMEGLVSCGDLFGLLRLLLADVEHADLSTAPNKLAERIAALAVDRPDLLHMLIRTVRQHAELLADLLFFPSTSVLACLLVAQWQAPHSAWDRELTSNDHQIAKVAAFADVVSVMGHFLRQELVNPVEVAALLEWLHTDHGSRAATRDGRADSALEILRAELARQSSKSLAQIADALTASMPGSGLGTSTFAAALDIIDVGGLTDAVDPSPIVDAYVRSVAEGDYRLTAHRITQGSALSLYKLAVRLEPERRHHFLYPVDVRGRLVADSEENPYTLADNIARSIRAHIRILSRAVAASTDSPGEELVDALVAAIKSGAVEHKEKGRVAAFAPRFETEGGFASLDRPIAADIGASLRALAGDNRDRVLNAMLQTDEPMVLAQLSTFVPQTLRTKIEQRVFQINPSDAGSIRSLTEMHARIDQLLAANMATVAARFMDEERDVKTLGKVPGRSVTRLHSMLRLHLLQGDWQAIADTKPPPDLSQMEASSAAETISFFQAISELKRPGGDVEGAERLFARLFHRHPGTIAYAVNLFAARISLLLGTNAFAVLDGAALTRGRQLLAEAEQIAHRIHGVVDSEVFASNMALLLLATGQTEVALQTLTSRQAVDLRDTVAAYTAIALSRLERGAEAVATLKAAEDSFGLTDVLRAATEHIENGSPFTATASVSSDNDPLPEARRAHHDFLLMDHEQQARVVRSSTEQEPFDGLVIDCVRSAAASATALASVVRSGDAGPIENDITAVVGEVLAAHIQFLDWALGPSPGGVTVRDNPGLRDLVLRKGTSTLAVVEAVMCKRPVTQEWSRGELTSHFQKLLAYSTCRLFFHLTYATIENPASIFDHLRRAAKDDVPAGFVYIDCKDIEQTDSRPTGLIARYKGEFGEIKVVFLVLDLGQHIQSNAAKAANETNPRNKKAGSAG
jgi:hypothetical protein